MAWQMIRISIEQVVSGEHEKVQDSFALAFAGAGGPENAALFSRPVADGYELYFSPEATRIAQALIWQYRGAGCSRPPKEGTTLLCGRQGAGDRLL